MFSDKPVDHDVSVTRRGDGVALTNPNEVLVRSILGWRILFFESAKKSPDKNLRKL